MQLLTVKNQSTQTLLNSNNLQNVKLGAKALHHDLPDNVELWDLAAFTIWSMNNNGDKSNPEF